MAKAPRLDVTSVTIGTPDPRGLAAFYARLLNTTVRAEAPPKPGDPPEGGWAQLRSTHEFGTITLNFEYEKQWRAPTWPAEPGRQTATQHLDIYVDDLEEATQWAVECGARLADHQPQDAVRVMFDPVGHPFCLFA